MCFFFIVASSSDRSINHENHPVHNNICSVFALVNSFTPPFLPPPPFPFRSSLLPAFFPLSGLILHKAIALVYLFLVSGLPGLFYLVLYPLSLTKSVNEFVSFQLHTIMPTFLLSLLEAQSVFHWTGGERLSRAVRVEVTACVKSVHRPCWMVG